MVKEKKGLAMTDYPKRGEIYWVQLDPTVGSEIQKTRPCLILSNNSQNKKGLKIIAAPITSKVKKVHPFEVKFLLKGRECKVLLDQLRALGKQRMLNKIDSIDTLTMFQVALALKITLALD